MGRPKNEKHSSDIDAEIRRLEEEKQRLIIAEDQRRGAIIREYLSGKAGDRLREILRPLVVPRDAFLFGLDVTEHSNAATAEHFKTGQAQASVV
jgi:hypothetical protein